MLTPASDITVSGDSLKGCWEMTGEQHHVTTKREREREVGEIRRDRVEEKGDKER